MKVLKTFLILFVFLPLYSCMSVAMTGVSGVYGRYNMQQQFNNQEIVFEINNQINNDPAFSTTTSKIYVSCFNYLVLLIGQTTSPELRQRATEITSHIHDVKHVYNFIELKPPISSEQAFHDSWITAKIKSSIIANAKMDPNAIKVITEDGTVYLLGFLTHRQAKHAIEIAQYTDGVKQVITIFRYVHYSIK